MWIGYAVYGLAFLPWGLIALVPQAIMLASIFGVTGIPPTENQAIRSKGDAYRTRPMDTSTASQLWHQLTVGDWSVVERLDQDRTCYLLATENEPKARRQRALTRRERQVVEQASRGSSNKLIAYDLGVATSTISTHLSRAANKLGLRSRTDVIQAFFALSAGRATRASISHVQWSGKRYAIVALPLEPSVMSRLSAAELEVAELVLAGKTNAQIAHARGVSPRTVENQIASAMRKVGATSRASLTALLISS